VQRIDARFDEDTLADMVEENLVEVVAAEMVVAVGCEDLENVAGDLQDRDVEGSAAEIEDSIRAGALAAEAVRERGGGWFINNAEDFEAGHFGRGFCRSALLVVEVRGDRDDGLADLLAEVILRDRL